MTARLRATEEVLAVGILVRYPTEGLTREQHDEVSRRMERAGDWPPDGLDMHVCFGSDGDLRVSEIWDSEEPWSAFVRDKLMPVLQDVGVSMNGQPDVFQVHDLQKR